jgi:hypothetical protein
MRIAIIVIGNTRRNGYLNGYNLRYGGGGASGTDTSSILIGEYLSKQGHEVVICTDDLDEPLKKEYITEGKEFIAGSESYGVKYTNINFDGIDNKDFDILINMLWFTGYDALPIQVTKSIIYWSHMQWIYGVDELIKFAEKHNLSIGVVNVSDWQKRISQGTVDNLKNRHQRTFQMTIPNPIFDEIINEVKSENLKKKKGKFIFHATWPTGGNVALDAVRQLDIEGKEFHALDYFISVDNHQDSFFHNHKSCDRKTVFKHLAESEYFIYPLYTIHKILRKDTFALTVAEAIAMDTIVITYPLGALPENYKDYCVWLDAPPGANLEELQMADLARDEEGLFLYTKNIVDKINYLESNPEIKEQYRNKGKEYILENFNLNTVGKIWDDFITKLMTK